MVRRDTDLLHIHHEYALIILNTYLSSVVNLAPDNALGSQVEIIVGIDDDRRLAAQFKGERSEVLGGSGRNDASNASIARIENMVPY